MRKYSPPRYVARPILLRAVAAINERGLASAKAVAEELRIPQVDARDLLAGEVQEGYLRSTESPADCKYRFVVYVLTDRGSAALGRAA